jgi:carbon monoxide dehydrogenase subunit G
MRLSGARTIRATPQAVWDFLMTPSRLRTCLPGCEDFEETTPYNYDATLRLGIAFLKGTYSGTLCVLEPDEPRQFRLEVEGGGPLGGLKADGTVKLVEAAGSTYFLYDGEAEVNGHIASLGRPVIEATAGRLIGMFFGCIAGKVEQGGG